MCEAILFSVAMSSARHALLALLIAANFVELKGQVHKRTDTNKLWNLACMVRGQGGARPQAGGRSVGMARWSAHCNTHAAGGSNIQHTRTRTHTHDSPPRTSSSAST